jgi:hypothetical protein
LELSGSPKLTDGVETSRLIVRTPSATSTLSVRWLNHQDDFPATAVGLYRNHDKVDMFAPSWFSE